MILIKPSSRAEAIRMKKHLLNLKAEMLKRTEDNETSSEMERTLYDVIYRITIHVENISKEWNL